MLNLKYIRTKKGYTQEKLSKKLNIVRSTISSWELGKTEPGIDNLIQLAQILEVSVDELLGLSSGKLDDLSELEQDLINLCRTIPSSKIIEGINYIKYISNK